MPVVVRSVAAPEVLREGCRKLAAVRAGEQHRGARHLGRKRLAVRYLPETKQATKLESTNAIIAIYTNIRKIRVLFENRPALYFCNYY